MRNHAGKAANVPEIRWLSVTNWLNCIRMFPLLRAILVLSLFVAPLQSATSPGNRLTYLDESDPFYVGKDFPKLTTPQWIGEPGVEAVVILAIDDMRDPGRYETYLRPILERLKKIDGRAPVSIFSNQLNPQHPHLQEWLKEGLTLEVHTLAHPCPLLAKSNFVAAADTYHQCVDLMNRIPGNKASAFRMPCCDSLNSPSPRFYAEIFNRASASNQFLSIDSSVMNIPTSADESLPREWMRDANGKEKFRKYLPFPSFVTTVENYPYPYVIGNTCWEFPAMVPSDWEAQHLHGTNNPVTVADWKTGLDIVVRKQGTFTFIFHPHGWIRSDQMVEFIDYAVATYGTKVRFLNFREAEERLSKNLLNGYGLRSTDGSDQGCRLIDLNHDGYVDVVSGSTGRQFARLWNVPEKRWIRIEQPFELTASSGTRLGIIGKATAIALQKTGTTERAWRFGNNAWHEDPRLLKGLESVAGLRNGRDAGLRLRDVDLDGNSEVIVANADQGLVFSWSEKDGRWNKLSYGLPKGIAIVNAEGGDNGLRFVDVNGDGFSDLLMSNEKGYSLNLFVKTLVLGFQPGWSREVVLGSREIGEIPMISQGGPRPNNGAWFHSGSLWVQNEETAHLPDLVDRRSFAELLAGAKPKAKSPAEALKSMKLRPGFTIELVAAEPLVKDPVAFDWGADGTLWVVEMGDYPLGVDGNGKPGGLIHSLQDSDGDGRYDKSTVFMRDVPFPTGLLPWRKGLLISSAPEIIYAEDTNGDGVADLRQVLFSGFNPGNQQHRMNGFDFGLDGWVYGANGDSGGRIKGSDASGSTDLRGHDFRFKPDGGAFEAIEGQTQFGRHRDDWGNWFGNNNPSWLWHFPLAENYLRRNPHLPVRSLRHYLANYPNSTKVFPASRQVQRFNDIGMAGHVTSGNSPTPYRDDLFGPEFASSIFISEPVHNVVHREVLEEDGTTFRSHRAAGEATSEFLASTDNWFRPTMLKTGPDGALYIADMYRFVLEHPEWIPTDTQKSIDIRAGSEQGRIYRVFPEGTTLRPIPNLAKLGSAELAEQLQSPNGWTRDTAQRLLLERKSVETAPALKRIALESSSAKSRLQALWTLSGLEQLESETLLAALRDAHSAVRRGALKLSENRLANAEVYKEVRSLGRYSDPKVLLQLAFTLGETNDREASLLLAELLRKHGTDENLRTAILSSALPHLAALCEELSNPPVSEALEPVVRLALRAGEQKSIKSVLSRSIPGSAAQLENWQAKLLAGILEELKRQNVSWEDFQRKYNLADTGRLSALMRQVADEVKNGSNRQDVLVHLLALNPDGKSASQALQARLESEIDPSHQRTILNELRNVNDPELPRAIVRQWKKLSPLARPDAVRLLASQSSWTKALLTALEENSIGIGEIAAPIQQTMLQHQNEDIQERAKRLFNRLTDRQKLVENRMASTEKKGDAGEGLALFQQHCATCHKLRGTGGDLGPDLATVSDKPDRVLLEAILDPNRSFEARYEIYDVNLKNGQAFNGMIAAESASSVTIKNAGNFDQTVLRSDLAGLSSGGRSLMPEGFENNFSDQELADLLAAIRHVEK